MDEVIGRSLFFFFFFARQKIENPVTRVSIPRQTTQRIREGKENRAFRQLAQWSVATGLKSLEYPRGLFAARILLVL